MTLQDAKVRRTAPLRTPSNLSSNSAKLISAALTEMLADMFALYLKTKNFHWHVSGPHFRDDHLMLDEQGAQILATTDAIAERVRKVGERRSAPSDIFPVCNEYWTMMPTTSHRSTCWLSSVTTISSLPPVCGRPTDCATKMVTSPARV